MATDATGHGGCVLCGLPTGSPENEYCCAGCERVHEILTASSYAGDPRQSKAYLEALRSGLVSEAARPESAVGKEADTTDKREFNCDIDGMWCTSCAWLVEETLGGHEGVIDTKISFVSDRASIAYDPKKISPTHIRQYIEKLGYGVSAAKQDAKRRTPLVRFGIAAFFTVNVMMFSYAFYAGSFVEVPDLLRRFLPWLLAALSAPVVFGVGFPIIRRAFRAAAARSVTMDTLIALGSMSAWFYSLGATLQGSDHIYFDSASALVTFWLLGRLIEGGAFKRAEAVGHAIARLLPKKVRRIEDGEAQWVATDELKPGDLIRVAPGERCPVDSLLRSDHALVSTAVVSGEPRPRRVESGGFVPGGAVCGEGGADLSVLRVVDHSILKKVAGRVAMATGKHEERQDISDALARIFLPIVLGLTAVTFAGWFGAGVPISVAFERALSVLVVSCPCALGLAAPLARVISAGVLASKGIVTRDEGTVDDLALVADVVFDKTGTLTRGDFTIVETATDGMEESEVLAIVAALEQGSTHPVASAVLAACPEPSIAGGVETVTGCGVLGQVAGGSWRVGKPDWVVQQSGEPSPELAQFSAQQQEAGHTVIFVGRDDQVAAVIAFGDTIKDETPALLADLTGMGYTLHVLSGDAEASVAAVCGQVGVPNWHSSMTPDDKADWLEQRAQSTGRRPVFVGDGINDAPALASAIGVAVATSTDFARETAAVMLLDREFDVLPSVFSFSRRMRRTILQNLGWAGVYNAVAIPAAMSGLLNPILAAAAMVGSGLIVTLNTLRLMRK